MLYKIKDIAEIIYDRYVDDIYIIDFSCFKKNKHYFVKISKFLLLKNTFEFLNNIGIFEIDYNDYDFLDILCNKKEEQNIKNNISYKIYKYKNIYN